MNKKSKDEEEDIERKMWNGTFLKLYFIMIPFHFWCGVSLKEL